MKRICIIHGSHERSTRSSFSISFYLFYFSLSLSLFLSFRFRTKNFTECTFYSRKRERERVYYYQNTLPWKMEMRNVIMGYGKWSIQWNLKLMLRLRRPLTGFTVPIYLISDLYLCIHVWPCVLARPYIYFYAYVYTCISTYGTYRIHIDSMPMKVWKFEWLYERE